MLNLVCLDRDGTINKDEDYYLGSTNDWKLKVEILPKVAEGIKKLNKLENVATFIITNQAGVALCDEKFRELTENRMHEVNEYIIDILRKNRAMVDGYFACPYVDLKYVEKAKKKGLDIDWRYVREKNEDLKPNIGMIKKAANSLCKRLEECNIFVIGDRASDVQLGLNAGGRGILIEGWKTRKEGDVEKVAMLGMENPGRVYIAKDFLDAADYVAFREF